MLSEFVWVSWRDHHGWRLKHVVPTQADTLPSECAGLLTLCGRYVPEQAEEYGYSPHGPCRPHEHAAPLLAAIMRAAAPDSAACAICRLRLADARPDLYSVPTHEEHTP
jgi:hypothetical protein